MPTRTGMFRTAAAGKEGGVLCRLLFLLLKGGKARNIIGICRVLLFLIVQKSQRNPKNEVLTLASVCGLVRSDSK